jgi:hypothetical protein
MDGVQDHYASYVISSLVYDVLGDGFMFKSKRVASNNPTHKNICD